MTLYEIQEEIYMALKNAVDEETGEIVGDLSALDELQIKFEEKAEGLGLYIKNQKSNAEQIKAEEQALSKRRKVIEKQVERLKQYLSNSLLRNNMKKIETPKIVLSFRKSTSVEIENAENLPKEFQKISIEADKTAIKNALKDGATIDGAALVEKENLQIK